MKKVILVIVIAFSFSSCFQDKEIHLQFDDPDILLINSADMPDLEMHKDIYVPAYSNLYHETDVHKTYFTVILSLRNISFSDTVYFERIEYYDTEGKLLKEFIEEVLVLRPMESVEYIVEAPDKKGGSGANFVVSYAVRSEVKNLPYIEAIMIGSVWNYGFGFSSPGIEINY